MVFDKEKYKEFILDIERITFSPEFFRLASDQESRFYINWRKKINSKFGITSGKNAKIVSNFLLDFLEDNNIEIDTFIGVPEAMSVFAGVVQEENAIRKNLEDYPLVTLRKEPKTHGDPKDRYFIGEPEGNIAVLEDITTTGGSLINRGIKTIQKAGYEPKAAITLIDRNPKKEYIEDIVKKETGVDYFKMIHVSEVLFQAYNRFTRNLEKDLEKEMPGFKD